MSEDDLELTVQKLRAELHEFMTDADIAVLEKNAVDETQLALDMFPKRKEEFYGHVHTVAEYDRFSRAKKLCLDYLRQKGCFVGYWLFGNPEADHWADYRSDEEKKKGNYMLTVAPFTEEQMLNRLKYHYGKGGKAK